ncbi:MAG: alpha/beta hydrolase [Neomegalonema sp.]|nr:alpha/beta hydrolase [Neomegalonema sp.]
MTLFERADTALLPGFSRQTIHIEGAPIAVAIAGDGPPLLMLHGDPQTHLCWSKIAPQLAERYTVVLPDLRGRGESHAPPLATYGAHYAKRVMAQEQRAVMAALGFERFAVIGHDRGARVARRLALDCPDVVSQLVVMDIIPALNFYDSLNAEVAQDYFYFYFTFLAQEYPIPETLINGDPAGFMRSILVGPSNNDAPYDPLALEVYLAASSRPQCVIAMCECFRAGFHIDRKHDEADRAAGRKIECPTLVMWGEQSAVGRHFAPEVIWREWCRAPQFAPMPGGHFIPEEAPDVALEAVSAFLDGTAADEPSKLEVVKA